MVGLAVPNKQALLNECAPSHSRWLVITLRNTSLLGILRAPTGRTQISDLWICRHPLSKGSEIVTKRIRSVARRGPSSIAWAHETYSQLPFLFFDVDYHSWFTNNSTVTRASLMPTPCLAWSKSGPMNEHVYVDLRETPSSHNSSLHRVLIVGGGAAGLELATRLGNTLGRRGKATITLLDKSRLHVWKPLLHEVASGSIDSESDSLELIAHARWHHYRYRIGAMQGLDRTSGRSSLRRALTTKASKSFRRESLAMTRSSLPSVASATILAHRGWRSMPSSWTLSMRRRVSIDG
jgi:hypothetical protein